MLNKILPTLILLACCAAVAAPDPSERAIVEHLSRFRFDLLGNPQIKSDSILPVLAPVERPHRLLVLLVEFSDLGFERFAGRRGAEEKNRRYIEKLLFAGGVRKPKPNTLTHYYQHQSRGLYNITGTVLPMLRVRNPLAYYGRPLRNADGSWRSDQMPDQLVVDIVAAARAANPDFNWRDYDIWDPEDFDGDGNRDEPDGYLDHLIIVYAGKGQSSCQGLYKLSEKFTVNASADVFDSLPPLEQQCADRIWPHRGSISRSIGKGPELEGLVHGRGGVEIRPGIWLRDYNMQSEYTEIATFIHEFGHSLGLPDIYAMETNNSTASWDVMSSTLSPEPQEMSAWSRMVLGWMQPCVIKPPAFGGDKLRSLYLRTMNDWNEKTGYRPEAGVCDSALVILPPKYRELNLGPLRAANGKQSLYSGQGNDMNYYFSRDFDFTQVPLETPLTMQLDAWFEIESDWDYLYVEAATEQGDWQRLLPIDKDGPEDNESVMPSKKGHEGPGSLPGFTGRSGDMDGDGKVESAPGCDPTKPATLAEDKLSGASQENPCEKAQWVTASFNLSRYRGQHVRLRFHYFTDGAAVENGALLDNIEIPGIGFREDFESGTLRGWDNQGFTLSGGYHHLAVPHYYLIEYRDPYADFDNALNYDANLREPQFLLYPGAGKHMKALNIRYRPGVLVWYYNGDYLWSENEPAQNGPGRGFLLLVDANPQEFKLPGLPDQNYHEQNGWRFYAFDDQDQGWLHKAYVDVMCYQRRELYYSSDVSQSDIARCRESLNDGLPPVEAIRWNGKQLLFGYTQYNDYLPGPERDKFEGVSTLFDLRIREGVTQYRLYDRVLRNLHSADAPFALTPFKDAIQVYRIEDAELIKESAGDFAPIEAFSDEDKSKYLNPKLPFGGVNLPSEGFSFQLAKPAPQAPESARVKIYLRWQH